MSRHITKLLLRNSQDIIVIPVEKPAAAGSAPLGARLKLCVGDTRIHRIGRAIIIIDYKIILKHAMKVLKK